VLIGAGRLTTVTTEAVALAAGGNRRVIGVYAFMQTLLAVSGFQHCNGFARPAIPQPARLAGVTVDSMTDNKGLVLEHVHICLGDRVLVMLDQPRCGAAKR
jgi:hypothetical protein